MTRIKNKKGNTPENFDDKLRVRIAIDPDDYTDYWRGVNRLKREFHENERGTEYSPEFASAWSSYNDEWLLDHFRDMGIPEPPQPPAEPPKRVRRVVRASKGWAVRDAKKFGGRVVRVDRNGKRNRRGRHWKAVKR